MIPTDLATWRDLIKDLSVIVAALTPLILALMNRNQKRAAAAAAADRAQVKQKLEETTENVDNKLSQIHETVNGNTRELMAEIQRLRAEKEQREQGDT